jgi:hypothetical protein
MFPRILCTREVIVVQKVAMTVSDACLYGPCETDCPICPKMGRTSA